MRAGAAHEGLGESSEEWTRRGEVKGRPGRMRRRANGKAETGKVGKESK